MEQQEIRPGNRKRRTARGVESPPVSWWGGGTPGRVGVVYTLPSPEGTWDHLNRQTNWKYYLPSTSYAFCKNLQYVELS